MTENRRESDPQIATNVVSIFEARKNRKVKELINEFENRTIKRNLEAATSDFAFLKENLPDVGNDAESYNNWKHNKFVDLNYGTLGFIKVYSQNNYFEVIDKQFLATLDKKYNNPANYDLSRLFVEADTWLDIINASEKRE